MPPRKPKLPKPSPPSGKDKKKKKPVELKSPFYPETLTPEGFKGRLPGQGQPGTPVPGAYTPKQAPLYQEGMQWEPTNWTPAEIWELQQALMASGYATDLTAKVWDEKSANAFKKVLTAANVKGTPWQEIITAGIESEEGYETAKGEERQPLTVELTSGQDLGALGVEAGQELTGRGMTPEEQMRFAAEYQGQERSAQEQAYGMAETGGTVTAPPSASVSAEQFLQRERPGDVAGYKTMEALRIWEDMLAGAKL